MQETSSDKKARWFGCHTMENVNLIVRLFFLTIQYFIWGAKLGKFIPSADFAVGETVYLLDNACSLNSELDACRTTLKGQCHEKSC